MLFLKKLWALVRSVLQFKIKRWHTAMRGWDETDARVLICLEDSIWYWVLMEKLFWDCGTWVCHWAGYIPLPKWFRNWERAWDSDEPDEVMKAEDWFGNDLGSIWHIHLCDPPLQWVWKNKDHGKKQPMWELTVAEAKEKFDDPEIWEWVEKSIAEHKQWDAEKAAEELAKNQQ